jgi:hypothetical protein
MTDKDLIQLAIQEHKRIDEWSTGTGKILVPEFFEPCYNTLQALITVVCETIGDNTYAPGIIDSTWLGWYIYENDCGAKEHEAGYDGKLSPIRNVDDLLALIEEGKNRE